jgi:hypothetical protein
VKGLAEGNSGCSSDVKRGESYRPRQPEQTVLYQALVENLETFLARERREDCHVPRFIEREFRKFLECGIPSWREVVTWVESRSELNPRHARPVGPFSTEMFAWSRVCP